MMWANKNNPLAVFGDLRKETVTVPDSSHHEDGTRTIRVEPDIQFDFRALPFSDSAFDLVVFDPPHLVRAGDRSWLAVKYGKLGASRQSDLAAGFAECFRVLAPCGTLIFKWNETQVTVREVLALCGREPLFGHLSGHKNKTHWLVFAGSRA
jgi:SAM-dependent methyltransferase